MLAHWLYHFESCSLVSAWTGCTFILWDGLYQTCFLPSRLQESLRGILDVPPSEETLASYPCYNCHSFYYYFIMYLQESLLLYSWWWNTVEELVGFCSWIIQGSRDRRQDFHHFLWALISYLKTLFDITSGVAGSLLLYALNEILFTSRVIVYMSSLQRSELDHVILFT